MRYFDVRCPKCKHTQKYHTPSTNLDKKIKRCVYCGFNIGVKNNVIIDGKPRQQLKK